MPSGFAPKVRDKIIDEALRKGDLLTYDPVVKAKEEEAESARKAKQEEAERARQAKIAAAKQSADRTKQIKSKHWPPDIEQTVLARKVQIGMTAEQVRFAWGKPEKNNQTVGPWGTHEQWVYGSSYLYFENGILRSYQTSR